MELHERFKDIRKNYLHLSQTELGAKLGTSRSVINNIERNVLAKPEQKISLLKLFCKECLINEDYLLYGNGPIFVEAETFSLDTFAKKQGATPLDIEVVKAYFELDTNIRTKVLHHFIQRLSNTDKKKDLFPGYRSSSDLEEEYAPEETDKSNSSAS